jgi:hypothetical protein
MPQPVRGLAEVEEIGGGDSILYARDAAGRVSWVGGDVAPFAPASDGPRLLALPAPAQRIVTGTFGGCALLRGGAAQCWGADDVTRRHPNEDRHDVPQLSGAAEVAVGLGFRCTVGADRKAYCWGDNSEGELGDGTTQAHATPAPVRDVDDVDRLVADRRAACALRHDGSVWCWGNLRF